MATIDECRAALDTLAEQIAGAHGEVAAAAAEDRSVSCRLTDLDDATFVGALRGGRLTDIRLATADHPAPRAQIRLSMRGDDLLALVAGDLDFAKAWLTGRIRLSAGLRDLLRLRALL